MFRRLIAYLLGHLRIEVRSLYVERFLNRCVEEEVTLWDIERLPESMEAEISLPSFFRLRPIARESRSRIRVLRRSGWPFLASRLKRRPVLLAGAVLCLWAIYWVTGHVWVVDVRATGQGALDSRAVLAIAAQAGLRPGVWKRDVDLTKVERELAKRIPELSWASASIKGVRGRIQLVEKTAYSAPGAFRTDLVARKKGLIAHLVTMSGEPAVKVGDYVRPGDTLIKGCLYYWQGGRPQVYPGTPLPPRDTVARCGPAEGEVRARIWYEQYMEVPLYKETRTPTGQRERTFVLKWKDRDIIVLGPKQPSFQAYDQLRWVWQVPNWRSWQFPVEISSLSTEEVTVKREAIAQAAAIEQVKKEFVRRLELQLKPGDRVVGTSANTVQKGLDFVGVKLTVETLEEIATPKEVSAEPAPEPVQNR